MVRAIGRVLHLSNAHSRKYVRRTLIDESTNQTFTSHPLTLPPLRLFLTPIPRVWEEFRGCGALEELMTRMGVIVGEGRYMLGGDLLRAFLPLLYVGEGLEKAGGDECGIDFLAGLSLGGKGKAQHQQHSQPETVAPQPDGACAVDGSGAEVCAHVYMHTDVRFYPPPHHHSSPQLNSQPPRS